MKRVTYVGFDPGDPRGEHAALTCVKATPRGTTLIGSSTMRVFVDAGDCDICGGSADGCTDIGMLGATRTWCYQCWASRNLKSWLPELRASKRLRLMDQAGIPRTFPSTPPTNP